MTEQQAKNAEGGGNNCSPPPPPPPPGRHHLGCNQLNGRSRQSEGESDAGGLRSEEGGGRDIATLRIACTGRRQNWRGEAPGGQRAAVRVLQDGDGGRCWPTGAIFETL